MPTDLRVEGNCCEEQLFPLRCLTDNSLAGLKKQTNKKKPRTVACAAAKFLPKSRRGDTEAINLDKRSKEDIKEKMTARFLGCDLRS